MSSSNTSPHHQYAEKDDLCSNSDDIDPLSLLEEKIKELNEETEENHLTAYKRKLSTDIGAYNQKKPKVKGDDSGESEIATTEASDCEKENKNYKKINISSADNDETAHDSELSSVEKTYEDGSASVENTVAADKSSTPHSSSNNNNDDDGDDGDDDDDDESKSIGKQQSLPHPDDEGAAAATTTATDADSASKERRERNEEKRKVQNLRKNIKDVLDDSQLDATTLAAQRQESERLARLQEAQRLMRETQRQQQAEKLANKTQQKVLSLLGESNEPINASASASSAIDLHDPLFEKLSLNPAISITPASKEALQSIQSLMSADEKIPDSDDDDVIIQPEDESADKSKAVVVDSSSDSDDCIILSDEEEEEDDEDDDDNNSGEHTNDLYNQPDAEGRVVINIGHSERESDIYVAPQIARIIKPHQIGGVRFLYDNIIESMELFEKSTGFGCILAHSMGLGKTLQLVCFCDIFLRHTSSKTVLIIMPINTLQNWVNEFNMWIPLPEDVEKSPLTATGEVRPRNFKIYVLNDSHKTLSSRAKVVLEWKNDGGVLMMGYEMYRLLSLKKQGQKKKKKGSFQHNSADNDIPSNEDQDFFDKIYDALVSPGPDLVVCDEGHRIKNASASTSLALKQIKSKRRVVLTGYPLQNNLLEYWCMVDFVRPSYLGTKTEFSNMFERPIQNGQCIDSTPQDCKLMRYRAHVLHSLLKGFVQRRSHMVLQKCLPQKTEHVLLVRLTPFQRKLYTVFMDEVVRSKKVPNPLKAFAVCCKIWNHPDVLYHFLKKRELDLEIELEEAENDRKSDSIKKRGRKIKDAGGKKPDGPAEKPSDQSNEMNPIRLESMKSIPSHPTDTFKPPVTPSSNDSAYSSNQSLSGSYENYNSYANYYDSSNPYQNYNSYTNGGGSSSSGGGGVGAAGGYHGWNGGAAVGSNYWQNNYYHPQADYYHSNSSYQSYYGNQQNSLQIPETKHQMSAPSSNQLNPPALPTHINNPLNDHHLTNNKPTLDNKPRENNGGLLADVIQKEQQEKNKEDISDSIVLKNSSRDDGIPYDWAVELMKDYVPDLLENSPKMEIFFCILDESIKLNDRILVFSQSLLTLNHIERFLHRNKIPNTDTFWMKNQSYFRLDGSTAALEREKLINEFNANTNVKLFLVSTRAGSLGINLVGANRVIVFDASWNPCHDTQAVCRVYRYGQSKSCYVYRLVVDNCLEKKIYDRQINKQGMADRVIDECNPDAHLSLKEVTSLCYDDGEDPEMADFTDKQDEYGDFVMKKVLCNFSKTLTKEPFQHESLLVDRKEKKLSQAEKRLAQRGYEMEKQAATKPTYNFNPSGSTNYRLFRTPDGTLIQRPIMNNSRIQPVLDFSQNQNQQNSTIRAENPKPNRWVPVEVWQSKGITAQEMTLPQDVSIQTNSADKSKIFLKAGQKVIVLKSPRGICLQLESGKVIAIRASMKPGQLPGDLKTPGIPGFPDTSAKDDASAALGLPPTPANVGSSSNSGGTDDVIDMTNSDDEEAGLSKILDQKSIMQSVSNGNGSVLNANANVANESKVVVGTNNGSSSNSDDVSFKEKPVYKPNLVQRKLKMMPSSSSDANVDSSISTLATSTTATTTTSSMYSNDRSRTTSSSAPYGSTSSSSGGHYPPPHKLSWNRYQDSPSSSSANYYRDMNGGTKADHPVPYQNQTVPAVTTASTTRSNDTRGAYPSGSSSSAFHPPSGAPFQNSYMQAPHYQPHNAYSGSTYQNSGYNYPSPAPNYNYYAPPHSYSSATPRNYHYPQYGSGYDTYAGYGAQYGALPTNSSYPNASPSYVPPAAPPTTTASQSSTTTPSPSSSAAAAATSYSQWNWNK